MAAIIGGVVGGVAALGLIAAAAYYLMRRAKHDDMRHRPIQVAGPTPKEMQAIPKHPGPTPTVAAVAETAYHDPYYDSAVLIAEDAPPEPRIPMPVVTLPSPAELAAAESAWAQPTSEDPSEVPTNGPTFAAPAAVVLPEDTEQCVAAVNFRAELSDELDLFAGDVVCLVRKHDDGWALVCRVRDGKEGMVPLTVLRAK
ncbi:hypothetical protein DFJ74DRAFT_644277 [Hyaloraphidium curvatum]|nr:hypothetical protein DFJ74DRAFT_644277 [Hyaloraphidium curvatum]